MYQELIFVVATVMACLMPAAHGTDHLSFANNTEVNITREGCDVSKLCVSLPEDCNPEGTGPCLFASIAVSPAAPTGSNLAVELRGETDLIPGYIAISLGRPGGLANVFLCGNVQNPANNRSVFLTAVLNTTNNPNNNLILDETNVEEIRSKDVALVIQCEFVILNLTATSNIFNVSLGEGSLNGTTPGPLNVTLNARLLDVTDLLANIQTNATSTTLMPTTITTTTPATTMTTTTTEAATMTTTPTTTSASATTSAANFIHHATLPVLLSGVVWVLLLRI